MLSLDDVREHGKQVAKEKEAKLRAQKQLRLCLENQMREHRIKSNISKIDKKNNYEVIIDRMKKLDQDHMHRVSIS